MLSGVPNPSLNVLKALTTAGVIRFLSLATQAVVSFCRTLKLSG
jgi:hypothetical protein